LQLKFITTQSEDGLEEVFTFPDTINHDAMAEALERVKNQTRGNWRRVFRKPISAGFVDSEGRCYGMSETLRLQSRPKEDTALLAVQVNC
jgi:hypothetical protein